MRYMVLNEIHVFCFVVYFSSGIMWRITASCRDKGGYDLVFYEGCPVSK
jgi:hypothetical protein